MQLTAVARNYFEIRYSFFKWRCSLVLVNKIALALGMAALTGLLAQTRIVLPFTPVPITGQTFAVLMAGVFLGRWWGGISMAIYAGLGAVGIPWFTGLGGGFSILIGPTGGYIFGFILAALFLGHFSDKYIKARGFISMFFLMMFANFILIHIPGVVQLGVWVNIVNGESVTIQQLLMMGTVPFIIGGFIKISAAAALAKAITPKRPY